MSLQTLSDKSLGMQLKVINAANKVKRFTSDALFRQEEGMEMVQAALLVVAALIAAVALFALFQTVGNVFTRANNQLNKY